MSAFESLSRHQREIDELLGDVRNAVASEQRVLADANFQLLAVKLLACMKAEHAVVYPRLADVAGLVAEVAQARREHDGIEQTLNRLRVGGLAPDAWDAELDRLARQISAHADLEEFSLFPIASLALSAKELARIEADYLAYHARTVTVAGPSITYDPVDPAPPELVIRFHAA